METCLLFLHVPTHWYKCVQCQRFHMAVGVSFHTIINADEFRDTVETWYSQYSYIISLDTSRIWFLCYLPIIDVAAPVQWNALPVSVGMSLSVVSFRKALKHSCSVQSIVDILKWILVSLLFVLEVQFDAGTDTGPWFLLLYHILFLLKFLL